MIDQAVQMSANESKRLLDYFELSAKKRDVYGRTFLEGTSVFPNPDAIVEHARMHDLTFLPVQNPIGLDELFTESVIFGSGRPTILLPASSDKCPPPSVDIVALSWDCSRAAARALADAMPILQKAKRVLVFTVINEKRLSETQSSDLLDQHLRLHGVDATIERVDAGGRPIGQVIENFVVANHVNFLVMGAFGHSRLREFILGGATRSILNHPPVPVLLSH
jgi:nucleotide-binding universal stress UspA family protein